MGILQIEMQLSTIPSLYDQCYRHLINEDPARYCNISACIELYLHVGGSPPAGLALVE
jgi:hypothetical protein